MRKTYTARAKRWEHGWELHVDGLGVTQSRTLRDAEAMVRDFVSLNTGLAEDAFDVTVAPEIAGIDAEIERLRVMVEEVERRRDEAAALIRNTVQELRALGLNGADTATVLGVSPQRVSQLLADAGPAGAARHVQFTRDGRTAKTAKAAAATKASASRHSAAAALKKTAARKSGSRSTKAAG